MTAFAINAYYNSTRVNACQRFFEISPFCTKMTVFDCAVFQIDFGCMRGEGSFSFYQLKNIPLLYSSKKGRFTRLFRKIFFVLEKFTDGEGVLDPRLLFNEFKKRII